MAARATVIAVFWGSIFLPYAVALAETITVSAAISLKGALLDIAKPYQAESGRRVQFNFGSSGQLAAQVQNGAPVDLFISAAWQQVEQLQQAGLVEPRAVVVARNRMVLVVPRDVKFVPTDLRQLADRRVRRVAVGLPQTVPAGQYAMQALRSAGIDKALEDRLVYGANARQVLDYVQRGEVDAAIVYRTDALDVVDQVRVAIDIDASAHEPIVYPAVIVKGGNAPAATRFINYLSGQKARAVWESRGYVSGRVATNRDDAETHLWPALGLSLRIGLMATALTVVVGLPLAFCLARRRFIGRSVIEALMTVPLVLPPTVVGYFLVTLFGARGPVGGWMKDVLGYTILFRPEGAVLAAAVVALPMLYIPAKAAFATVERELEDAARQMGATWPQTLWHVSLPLARRGVLSGVMLAFARALGEFGATVMVLGHLPNRQTLPILIYSDYEAGQLAHATAAVLTLTIISLAVIFIYNRSSAGKQE